MRDERVLESLLEGFDDDSSVLTTQAIKSVWEAASRHQFDTDTSKVREALRSVVSDVVESAMASEAA